MTFRRGTLTVAFLCVAALAACSGDTDPGDVGTSGVAVDVPDGWTMVEGEEQPAVSGDPDLPTTVTDGTGATVEVDDVSRIIVGGDDVAEILGALGLGDKVYAAPEDGASEIAQEAPVQFSFSQQTGTEGLLSIDGTIFIGNNPSRHGDVAAQFRSAGVDAVVYDDSQSTADKIRQVAEYVGVKDAGEELASTVEDQLASAAEKAGELEGTQILQVTSSGAGGADAVVGTGTAGADIVDAIGATSIGVEAGLRGYSREYSDEGLLDTRPDVILMGTADLEDWGGLDGFLEAFPTLKDTPAFENNRIIVMPSIQVKVSGPAIGVGAEALADELTAA